MRENEGILKTIDHLRIMIYHWMVVVVMMMKRSLLLSVEDNGCLSLDENRMMNLVR